MPTAPRVRFPGALYHLTVRGVDRQPIVRDDVDRERWVLDLSRAVARSGAVLHAWCLMTNHFHLVVETPRGNVHDLMRILNASYAQAFNRRHGRLGPLFQRRYQAILIERESHLLEVSRYVVLNPVRADLCGRPDAWRWSSYSATAGLRTRPRFLTTAWLQAQFGRDPGAAAARYAEFVGDGAPAASLAGLLTGIGARPPAATRGTARSTAPAAKPP